MPQKRMECFRLLFDHLAWIEHEFLSGIRDSRKAGSLWGMMMRVVRGVRKSTDQSWLGKGWGLGLLCWGFKGVQEEIPSKEASTLQIGIFGYSLSSEAVVMRQLRRWKRLWWRSLTCSHKRTSMGLSRSCWNGTTALQPEEIASKGTRISYKKSLETYLMILVYIYIYIYIYTHTPSVKTLKSC